MGQWLMDLLPDLHVGSFEVRDLLNLVIAATGLYVAYQANRIATWQKEVLAADRAQKGMIKVSLEVVESEDRPLYRFTIHNYGSRSVTGLHIYVAYKPWVADAISLTLADGARTEEHSHPNDARKPELGRYYVTRTSLYVGHVIPPNSGFTFGSFRIVSKEMNVDEFRFNCFLNWNDGSSHASLTVREAEPL